MEANNDNDNKNDESHHYHNHHHHHQWHQKEADAAHKIRRQQQGTLHFYWIFKKSFHPEN